MELPIIEQSDEAKKLMATRGWDKGYVVFGNGASEATVKVLTTVCLLKGTDFKHVDITFDDAALGEEDKVGVKTDTWKLLTAGRSQMPALAIDGVMHMESEMICRKLAKESGASAEVLELIELSLASSERMFDAVKHWAWSGLHASMGYAIVNKDHYTSCGQGTQTEVWEKESGKVIDTFMKALEAKLAAKPALNGYFVGDSLTVADCVLINWYLTLGCIGRWTSKRVTPSFARTGSCSRRRRRPAHSGTTSTSPASATTAPTPIRTRARRVSTSTPRCLREAERCREATHWRTHLPVYTVKEALSVTLRPQ